MYVDGKRVAFDYGAAGLEPGQDNVYLAEGHYHFKPTRPGTYTYRWILDKEDLPETDETNNVIEGVVTERSAEHDQADRD